jgi:glycosyltransferase involved in cell wall biosynthesis
MMRLYAAIQKHESHRIRISVRVIEKTGNDDNVIGGKPRRTLTQRWRYFFITRFRKRFPRKEFASPNKTYRSQCLHHSGLGKELNNGPWDMAVLHWLGDKTMSIEEIGKLRIPYLWHLHDMWLFSGADHTSTDRRYTKAYSSASRLPGESGPDINRKVFQRKMRSWRTPRRLITPSSWLANETQLSSLTRSWPVATIPNPVDTEFWYPMDQAEARNPLGINPDATVFLFGAYAGANATHKGPDIFFDALRLLASEHDKNPPDRKIHILLFGKYGGVPDDLPFPLTHLGPVTDENLRAAYAASTVTVVPSRVESFGQIATEAHACGRPVIATRVGGLVDIVTDGDTGKLVGVDNPNEVANAMVWVTETPQRAEILGHNARQRAENLWPPAAVAGIYVDKLLGAL